MNCSKCGSKFLVKAGFINDKQRFKCNNCNYHFIDPALRQHGMPEELKQKAVQLVREGKSIRQAAKRVGISHVSVLKWLKEAERS